MEDKKYVRKPLYTIYVTSTGQQEQSKMMFCLGKIKFLKQNQEGDKVCERCWVDNTKEK